MFNKKIIRREAFRYGACSVAALSIRTQAAFGDKPATAAADAQACTLGFSTYGMKSLKVEDAVNAVAKIGYDAIEIAVRPDWDSAPARMPRERRIKLRQQLNERALRLASLMEHLMPSDDDKVHAAQLSRLESVFQLANDLAPEDPPLVQTILGGGEWNKRREFLRDRLADWLKLAEKHQIVLAIKPHRGGVMSKPSEAVWMIEQFNNPRWLRMVYDYSHYAFRDMPLDETIATALPYTAHVAVKDPAQTGRGVTFQLPGEAGTVDYASLIRQFHTGGYRGDFNCEVSGMVWSKKEYDPIIAARRCYTAISRAFEESGAKRPEKRS